MVMAIMKNSNDLHDSMRFACIRYTFGVKINPSKYTIKFCLVIVVPVKRVRQRNQQSPDLMISITNSHSYHDNYSHPPSSSCSASSHLQTS